MVKSAFILDIKQSIQLNLGNGEVFTFSRNFHEIIDKNDTVTRQYLQEQEEYMKCDNKQTDQKNKMIDIVLPDHDINYVDIITQIINYVAHDMSDTERSKLNQFVNLKSGKTVCLTIRKRWIENLDTRNFYTINEKYTISLDTRELFDIYRKVCSEDIQRIMVDFMGTGTISFDHLSTGNYYKYESFILPTNKAIRIIQDCMELCQIDFSFHEIDTIMIKVIGGDNTVSSVKVFLDSQDEISGDGDPSAIRLYTKQQRVRAEVYNESEHSIAPIHPITNNKLLCDHLFNLIYDPIKDVYYSRISNKDMLDYILKICPENEPIGSMADLEITNCPARRPYNMWLDLIEYDLNTQNNSVYVRNEKNDVVYLVEFTFLIGVDAFPIKKEFNDNLKSEYDIDATDIAIIKHIMKYRSKNIILKSGYDIQVVCMHRKNTIIRLIHITQDILHKIYGQDYGENMEEAIDDTIQEESLSVTPCSFEMTSVGESCNGQDISINDSEGTDINIKYDSKNPVTISVLFNDLTIKIDRVYQPGEEKIVTKVTGVKNSDNIE